ncbi:fumarylacetoacetase [Bradyrhizobium sp. ma5]|uniref:fumarylacetoacetase n=1 Tax=Bradyrhizobium sp. ma5 TaxID=3344828 RepID=UPI0035D3E824
MPNPDLDASHDVSRRSWVTGANHVGTDFPIQNLPFGIFRAPAHAGAPRGGVAIGDCILDVSAVASLLGEAQSIAHLLAAPTLQPLMSQSPSAWTALRLSLSNVLAAGRGEQGQVERHLHPIATAEMFLPARPGGFVDFFASIQHATNAGRIFRPDAPLLPNYKYVPIGYNGRVSTISVSRGVRRPCGQTRAAGQDTPLFGPSRRLDFETELGVFLGGHSVQGTPVSLAQAWDHVFGFCLLNDWSARDIQAWEYQPLGPFLGKSFSTTVSPWVVTADALRPFRTSVRLRPAGDPMPLAYLADKEDQANGAVDIMLETKLATARMRREENRPILLGRASTRELYWSVGQLVAHHTSNGCSIEAGDLYGSGTVSGDDKNSLGSLLEITRAGEAALELPGGEWRTFLEDGDEVTITGRCVRDGFVPIGFGCCAGRILPALAG